MKVIRNYLAELLKMQKREDGREPFQCREVSIETGVIARSPGSARVKIGDTEVLVGVKLDVGEPFPDTPNEGVLIINAELIPLASPDFETGPPKPEAIELARVTDRGIREGHAIDVEKLCIKKGEKVWMVNIDVYPMNDDGNLIDASALGAIAALKTAVFPKYDESADKVEYKEFTKTKLPVKALPIMTTFGKLAGSLFLDPTHREEKAFDSRLSISTLDDGTVCAMQKGGFGTFTKDEVLQIMGLAIQKSKELRKLLK
ncbi:MAG: exosome complex protein Rrp42 [DPANN group archaeon]|nr:exosome complex protein Rrp42 [DPANN group archaeon]